MRTTKLFAGLAAVAGLAMSGASAFAGFTASTGLDPITYTAPGTLASPVVGGTISTSSPLASYTPDTAADPQIAPGDIGNFIFSLNLTVDSVTPSTGAVVTTGSYSLIYNFAGGIPVSTGLANLSLTPVAGGFSVAAGSLTQTAGPANPAFADLSYGDPANIVLQGGFVDSNAGTLALTLRQNAVVPEPATLSAIAGLGLMGPRRRRA